MAVRVQCEMPVGTSRSIDYPHGRGVSPQGGRCQGHFGVQVARPNLPNAYWKSPGQPQGGAGYLSYHLMCAFGDKAGILSRSALWYHRSFQTEGVFIRTATEGATCEARRVASHLTDEVAATVSAGVNCPWCRPRARRAARPPGTQAARGHVAARVPRCWPTIDRGAPLIYPNSRVRAVPRVGPVNKPIENSAIFGRVVCVSICQGGGRCNHFVFKQPNR